MENEKLELTKTEQLFSEYIANVLCIKDLSETLLEYVPTMCGIKEIEGESNDEDEFLFNAITAVQVSLEKRNKQLFKELCNTKSLIHREIYTLRHYFYIVNTQSKFGILPVNQNMVKDYDESDVLHSIPQMNFRAVMELYLNTGLDEYREFMSKLKTIDEELDKKERFKVVK